MKLICIIWIYWFFFLLKIEGIDKLILQSDSEKANIIQEANNLKTEKAAFEKRIKEVDQEILKMKAKNKEITAQNVRLNFHSNLKNKKFEQLNFHEGEKSTWVASVSQELRRFSHKFK